MATEYSLMEVTATYHRAGHTYCALSTEFESAISGEDDALWIKPLADTTEKIAHTKTGFDDRVFTSDNLSLSFRVFGEGSEERFNGYLDHAIEEYPEMMAPHIDRLGAEAMRLIELHRMDFDETEKAQGTTRPTKTMTRLALNIWPPPAEGVESRLLSKAFLGGQKCLNAQIAAVSLMRTASVLRITKKYVTFA